MIMTKNSEMFGIDEKDLNVQDLLDRMEKFYETGITKKSGV